MESGNRFIEDKYKDTQSSKERDEKIRSLDKETLTDAQKSRLQERLLSIPERLELLEQKNPKRLEKLIDSFTDDVVIDITDEALVLKLARALYESEKRIAITRGLSGQVEELESNDTELLTKYRSAIIEKYEIQKRTLASWFEYIQQNDADYEAWFRYYVIRSLKDMGQFSRDDVKYSNRSETTIALFPEMNAESIAFVKKSLDYQLEVESFAIP